MILFIIFTFFTLSSSIMIKNETMDIDINLGSSYSNRIPIIFFQFQHSEIMKIQPVGQINGEELCIIEQVNGLEVQVASRITYDSSGLDRNQIVFNIQKLKTQVNFVDAINYDNYILALFSTNRIHVYQFTTGIGVIKHSRNFTIDYENPLVQAQFVQIQGDLLLISSKVAFKISKTLNDVYKITDFEGLPSDILYSFVQNKHLYLSSQSGLTIFEYSNTTSNISKIKHRNFTVQIDNETIILECDEHYISPAQKSIYILDYEDGLFQLSFDISSDESKLKSMFLRSGCRNLMLTSLDIFMTCPELVKMDRYSKSLSKISQNNFYPYKTKLMNQRIYLFGRRDFAVYDLFGKSLAQYSLPQHSQDAMIMWNSHISFGFDSVISSIIIPIGQSFRCTAADEQSVGKYNVTYISEGACKEYTGAPVNATGMCYAEYFVNINIKNPIFIDYTIELILIAVWLGLSFLVALYFFIKDCRVKRAYRELIQQESKQFEGQTKQLPHIKKTIENLDKIQVS